MINQEELRRIIMKLFEKAILEMKLSVVLLELEKLALRMGLDEREVMRIYVEAANARSWKDYVRTPFEKRVVLLPHCLRSENCEAKMGEYGYKCVKCGRCAIGKIVEKAEELGYMGVFILPGGSLVERIIDEFKPRAVLGVACLKECILGHAVLLKKGIPGQAVPLLRDGCFKTVVDVNKVIKVMSAALRPQL